MSCAFETVPVLPVLTCIESGAAAIQKVYIRRSDKPFVLLTKTVPEETYESQFTRSLAAELAKSGIDKVYVLDVFKGTMPRPTGTYKTNPQTGEQFLDGPVNMLWDWIDYRDNQELWDWYADMTGSERDSVTGTIIPSGLPVQVRAWALAGYDLIGGLSGYVGNLIAEPSIEQGSEVGSRMNAGFRSQIQGTVPRRAKLAA